MTIKDDILFVRINNQKELEKAIEIAEKNNFHRISNNIPTFEQAKKNYHGNSKLILHLFPNNILNRCEWQISTLKTEKTYYPAYKKPILIDLTEKYLNN